MAKRKRDDAAKPLADALDDALTAVADLVHALRERAREGGSDTRTAGARIRQAAEKASRGAKTRLEKAWDVLVHGDDEAPSPKRKKR